MEGNTTDFFLLSQEERHSTHRLRDKTSETDSKSVILVIMFSIDTDTS
jgi:hypothetical protein